MHGRMEVWAPLKRLPFASLHTERRAVKLLAPKPESPETQNRVKTKTFGSHTYHLASPSSCLLFCSCFQSAEASHSGRGSGCQGWSGSELTATGIPTQRPRDTPWRQWVQARFQATQPA